jgi:hypothetical protein
MYYRICSNCGANLDPGERCDCEEERQKQTDRIISMKINKDGQYELAMVGGCTWN